MAEDKPIVHLVCTAHLDPVWMWGWEEGAREAISTFRTAADLLDAFPEFVFNHNESLLYAWVEEYDPFLFARIQRLVEDGRWNITGGWYLQPDLNLPGGESLVRVILLGRQYFAEKFGLKPPVAYNFDSFGHPGSLPQLLRQSGFDYYIHCRPIDTQMDLPAPLYRWRGIDGTEIITLRPNAGWYGTPRPGQAQEQAHNGIRLARETGRDVLVTWGLGDHGGGATRQDLAAFRAILDEFRDSDVIVQHSTPEAYFQRVAAFREDLPVQSGELQRTLMGTYTSVAPIKRQMREGESLLASAERWAATAWWRLGWEYPTQMLADAWQALAFNTFHDILCGSLLEEAIPGVDDRYGYAHDIARRIIVKNQHALLPNIAPTPDTIPVYVLNPHARPMRAPVGLNFLSAYGPPPEQQPFVVYADDGKPIPSQDRGGSSTILDEGTWQPFAGFIAEVPPLSARRYEIKFTGAAADSAAKGGLKVTEDDAGVQVETQWWQASFSREAAALVSLTHHASGHELLTAPLQLFAMQDQAHAWGGENNAIYNVPVSPLNALSANEVGDFVGMEGRTGPALRIMAQGDVWVTVECLVGWQHTRASIRYTLYTDLPQIDIDTRVYMQARRKMIKLVFPLDLPAVKAFCEVPYGVAERPADATEYPYTRWVRLESSVLTVGIANSGQNGLDVDGSGRLGLSLTRGGTHCSWSEEDVPTEKSYTFMDQTQIDTRFRLVAGEDPVQIGSQLITAALELNQPLERFFVYHPPQLPEHAPAQPAPFLSVEPESVILGALKKAENSDALIIRLVESNGQTVVATVTLENEAPQALDFRPYEIRTFIVTRHDGQVDWQSCNLLEER
ncbi:MAG: alpha-mannosidase [Chloroflexi bacterium]|nr:alpha-mannosidase [Chloroflexota bacterium]